MISLVALPTTARPSVMIRSMSLLPTTSRIAVSAVCCRVKSGSRTSKAKSWASLTLYWISILMTTMFSSLVSILELLRAVRISATLISSTSSIGIRNMPVRAGLGHDGSFTEIGFRRRANLRRRYRCRSTPIPPAARPTKNPMIPLRLPEPPGTLGILPLPPPPSSPPNLSRRFLNKLVQIGRAIVITLPPGILVFTRFIPGHN